MYPQRATTVQAWLEADQHRKAKYKNKVWIAFVDEAGLQPGGPLSTVAGYAQNAFDYHPQKFYVFVNVLPEYQQQGISTALYERIMADLQPFALQIPRADCSHSERRSRQRYARFSAGSLFRVRLLDVLHGLSDQFL